VTGDCAACGTTIAPQTLGLPREETHEARGLCSPCYGRALHADRLDEFPRRTRSRDELMSEWDHLRRAGVEWWDAHRRLGMTAAAFERAYWRARAAGDPRAIEGVGQRPRLHRAPRATNWASAPTMRAALNEAFGDTHELAS
jgi:hypothetical protein